jgi:hypothetical protein
MNTKNKLSKKTDVLLITAFLISAVMIVITLHPIYFVCTLLIFLPSCIYLSIRVPQGIKPLGIFSLFYSVPLVLIVDYLATISGSWLEVTSFGFRVLGVVPIETFIWGLLSTYLTIMFYQRFFLSPQETISVPSRALCLLVSLWVLAAGITIVHFIQPSLLVFSYYYAKLVIVAFVVPIAFTLTSIPHIAKNIILQSVYFALASLLAEIAFLSAGSWSFPGTYVATVRLFSHTVPLEELAWLVLCIPTVLCGYEYFIHTKSEE